MQRNQKEERIAIFEETKKLCQIDKKLVGAIERTKRQQKVIVEAEPLLLPKTSYEIPAEIVVSQKRSFAAAHAYVGKKICVLNFASATNAGGGVERGSNAQEESLCRCSTLYPCISDQQVTDMFHHAHCKALHNGNLNSLYNDDCIYTPGVVVFRSDSSSLKLLPKESWYEVDVISCAAPNLRSKPSNPMNPDAGSKAAKITNGELLKLHKKRIGRILDIAGCFGEQVVILGAFGCGAFQNPADVVARAMRKVVMERNHSFQIIEFAVCCPPQDTTNYDIFKQVLSFR